MTKFGGPPGRSKIKKIIKLGLKCEQMRKKVTFLGGRNFNKNGGVLQSQHNYVDHLQAIDVDVWGEGLEDRGCQ